MTSSETSSTPSASAHPEDAPGPRTLLPVPWAIWFWGHVRRVIVFVIGMTILGLGVAMLVLPGPGWLTIFGGLALLATEFAWAKWMLAFAQKRLSQLVNVAMKPREGNPGASQTLETLPTPSENVKLHKVDTDIHNKPQGSPPC